MLSSTPSLLPLTMNAFSYILLVQWSVRFARHLPRTNGQFTSAALSSPPFTPAASHPFRRPIILRIVHQTHHPPSSTSWHSTTDTRFCSKKRRRIRTRRRPPGGADPRLVNQVLPTAFVSTLTPPPSPGNDQPVVVCAHDMVAQHSTSRLHPPASSTDPSPSTPPSSPAPSPQTTTVTALRSRPTPPSPPSLRQIHIPTPVRIRNLAAEAEAPR